MSSHDEAGSVVIRACEFLHNSAKAGDAVSLREAPAGVKLDVIECTFFENSGEVGAGLFLTADGPVDSIVRDCVFAANTASASAAGAFHSSRAAISGTVFLANATFGGFGTGSGLVLAEGGAQRSIVSCDFRENVSLDFGAAISLLLGGNQAPASLHNCVVANNVSLGSLEPAAIQTGNAVELRHCSVFGSMPTALRGSGDAALIRNSIIHGNEALFASMDVDAQHSIIEGGWTGAGNLDANPAFAAPEVGDLRLLESSPALDAGSAALVPTDLVDLDQDGDTSEPLPLDIGGLARIQGAQPDMGAHEGIAGALPAPMAEAIGVAPLESVVLDPESRAGESVVDGVSATFRNLGDAPANVTLMEFAWPPVEASGGWAELGLAARLETTQADGGHVTRVVIPINYSMTQSLAFFELRAVRRDPATSLWDLAVRANSTASPGHPGPEGDFLITLPPGSPFPSDEPGDHGVYFDYQTGQGHVWANVDVAGDFGVGREPECPPDIHPAGGNHLVDASDLGWLLSAWGADGGPADLDGSGTVDADDLGVMLGSWGAQPCGDAGGIAGDDEESDQPRPPRLLIDASRVDFDRDGRIGSADLGRLLTAWNARGEDRDIDGDGLIGRAELRVLMAAWDG